MKARRSAYQRFAEKVAVQPSGCWQWTGALNIGGYGLFFRGDPGKRIGVAHRWAYETWIGPIPEGLQLDHLCRNEACVNPAHLEPVTPKENLRRSDAVTGKRSARTHCPLDHEYTPENTRVSQGRRHCRTCERMAVQVRRELITLQRRTGLTYS